MAYSLVCCLGPMAYIYIIACSGLYHGPWPVAYSIVLSYRHGLGTGAYGVTYEPIARDMA